MPYDGAPGAVGYFVMLWDPFCYCYHRQRAAIASYASNSITRGFIAGTVPVLNATLRIGGSMLPLLMLSSSISLLSSGQICSIRRRHTCIEKTEMLGI